MVKGLTGQASTFLTRSSMNANEERVLLERYGIPIWQCEGLFMHYYASPAQLLMNQLTGARPVPPKHRSSEILILCADRRLEHSYGALVTLREGSTSVKLPVTSQIDMLASDRPTPDPTDQGTDSGSVRFRLSWGCISLVRASPSSSEIS